MTLVLSQGTTEKSLAPSSSLPLNQVCIHLDEVPLRLLFSWLNCLLIREMFQSPNHLSGPLLALLQYPHVSLVLGGPAVDLAIQTVLTRAEQWGRITSLDLLPTPCLIQPRVLLATFAMRARCWDMVSLVSPSTPRPFSPKLLFQMLPCGKTPRDKSPAQVENPNISHHIVPHQPDISENNQT